MFENDDVDLMRKRLSRAMIRASCIKEMGKVETLTEMIRVKGQKDSELVIA